MGVHLFILTYLLFVGIHQCLGQVEFIYAVGDSYSEINEEQPVGTLVIDLDVQYDNSFGIPQDESTGLYSFVSGFDESYFTLNFNTGEIRNAVLLDRDADNATTQFTIQIKFTSNADSTIFGIQVIQITLLDINDNEPIFTQSLYSVTVPENQPPGSSFYHVLANDSDQVQSQQQVVDENLVIIYTISNGRVIYSIIAGNEQGHFTIHPDDGTLSIAMSANLDVDTINFYNLTIKAEDGGGLNDTSLVLIMIIDSNDNSPAIHYPSSFSLTFYEDISPELVIVESMNATDDDSGLNAAITFAIVSGDVTNSFFINSSTGQVIMTDNLDREAGNPIILTLAAIDQGIPPLSDTITVTITLLDINDSPPVFTENVYEFLVDESANIGVTVGQVEAIDLDAGQNGTVFYSIINNTHDFEINNVTGDIVTAATLDRETIAFYLLLIQAIDNPANVTLTFTSTALVNITVNDVNDNPPMWAQSEYSVGILETESIGYILTNLQATDADIGTNAELRYEFFQSTDSTFAIDPITGNVTVNKVLDFSTKSSYTYTVRTFDNGIIILDATTQLLITIHTPNIKAPKFKIKAYNETIKETTSIGTIVLNVTAIDNDPGLIGELHYRIPVEWQFGGAGSFDVDADTGAIFVNDTLDYDYSGDDNSIFFEVEAYDGGFPEPLTARTNITIFLLNTNDESPMIVTVFPNLPTIPENMNPGVDFANLSDFTIDPDPGDGGLFNFSLLQIFDDDPSNSSFNLTSTGMLTALKTFDREARPEGFILLVVTTDFGSPTQSRTNNVTVAIGDENDNTPFFEEVGIAEAYEFVPAGQVVLQNYTAVDHDIGTNALLVYAITDGNIENRFTIDSSTGTITTAKVLNKTEERYYNLTIMAMDSGIIPLYGYGQVHITVLDANDNAPVFIEPLTTTLREDSSIGSIFYTLNVTDSDEGTNSYIAYFFAPNTTTNFTYFDNLTNTTITRFSLNSSTGALRIEDVFDREIEESYELTIIAIDMGMVPISLTSTATIIVNIEDVNDNIPLFANDSYFFNVTENEIVGTPLGYVYGTDDDATYPNNKVVFSLFGNRSDALAVNSESGLIYVNGTVDWEEGSEFTIAVVVSDLGEPPLSSQVNLTVYIDDINDRAPEWNITSLNISVHENLPPGASAGRIQAIDPDSEGNSSLVVYSIVMDFSDKHFALNSTTGEVTTLKTFNREARDLYDFVVVATDHGYNPLSSSAIVYIEILDDNDHDPYFLHSTFSGSISENADIGTSVLQVYADDEDIGSNGDLIYSISTTELPFYINVTTGVVYVKSQLDFETTPYYEFTVRVNDSGVLSRESTSTVYITLIDYNDNNPVFESTEYSITFVENIAVGTVLLKVNASDVDQGDNSRIEYILVESDGSSYFGIDNDTGVIFTIAFIDREDASDSINLTIIANNSNSDKEQYTTVPVFINILDLNDQAPTFNSTITVNVPENTSVGSVVYTLLPKDGDEGLNGTITYQVINGDVDEFDLNSTTGMIKLLTPLNYEGQRYYYLTINATDMGEVPLSNYTSLIFEVIDSNDHSPELAASSYFVTISYTEDIGTKILSLSASDRDTSANDAIQYSIVPSEFSSLFSISSSTGSIFTDQSLASYQGMLLNLTVQATDGEHNGIATVSVHIRGSTVPVFTKKSYTVSIPEDHDASVSIVDLYSNASPAKSTNVFMLVGGNDDNAFTLLANGKLFVVTSKLDYESKAHYQLSVSVTESNITAYTILNVLVTDVNEFIPIFPLTSYYAPVSETTPRRQQFFRLIATDDDRLSPANTIRYSIASGNEANIFYLDSISGELSLERVLNYNTDNHNYTLNITAANSLSSPYYSSSTIVNVELMDGNGHTPSFSPFLYNAILYEDTAIGTPIDVVVTAFDDDFGSDGTIIYGLLGDHRNYDFEINPITGNITVGPGGLDYERHALYTLRAVASDGGVPQRSATAVISVTVIDINDNSPIWEANYYNVTVMENITIGTEIIQVEATDLDPVTFTDDGEGNKMLSNKNGYITYSITDGDPLSQFYIHPESGFISVQASLDRERYSNYTLLLNATDGGGLYANAILFIKVLDINDVIPHIISAPAATIPEDAENGTFIIKVLATDEDPLPYSEIIYSIVSGNLNDTFFINTTTGELFLNNLIDREEQSYYNLTIEAVDNGLISLTGFSTLLINVLDINDHTPTFDKNSYTADVFENQLIGVDILQINATDRDYKENGTVLYSIISGNDMGLFEIESETGLITVAEDIDFEIVKYQILIVEASDSSHIDTRLSNTVNITISILDRNDNAPLFSQESYVATVFEDGQPGDVIISINASDIDSGSNAEISYSLFYNGDIDAETSFIINSTFGSVSLSSTPSLDRELKRNFTLYVNATDNGSPPMKSSVELIVIIEDTNDNAPVFTSLFFEGSVVENLPPGQSIVTIEATDADIGTNGIIQYSVNPLVLNLSQCQSHCINGFPLCSIVFNSEDNRGSFNQLLNESFEIDISTGLLLSSVSLDRELVQTYVLLVTATDNGIPPLSASTCVFINITDTNDEIPVFNDTLYQVTVPENAASNYLVTTIQAYDHDEGENKVLTYSLTDGSGYFTIHPNYGEIRALTSFDRENQDTYNITVLARDGGSPMNTGTTTVVVTITDENDIPPTFDLSHYTTSIPENALVNSLVTTVTAFDGDIGINSKVIYKLISVLPQPHFTINSTTGNIFNYQMLDREAIEIYNLIIMAEDNGINPLNSTALLTINVTDINDNPPLFTQDIYNMSIFENLILESALVVVEANDFDIGTNADIYYNIVSINPSLEGFTVNTTNGELYLNRELNAELTSTLIIVVQADNGEASPYQYTNTTIFVQVLDVNDNAPQFEFSEYVVPISELASNGNHVIQLNATDNDITVANTVLTYSIISDNTSFAINETTGLIFVDGLLDSEDMPVHLLEVLVIDSGVPSLNTTVTVTVLLQNANDNRPVFQHFNYSFTIVENQPDGTYFGQVFATDADLDNITYQISNDTINSTYFQIDSISGELYSNISFDRELESIYTLTIQAIDDFLLGTSSEVDVTVEILDENDNHPEFSQDIYHISLLENTTISSELFLPNVSDYDIGNNSTVVFSLSPTIDSAFFSINATSGLLALEQEFDRESQDMFTITIIATDDGIPVLNSSAEVIIQILDINDNTPVFNQSIYKAALFENSNHGTEILTVYASDNDIDENAQLSFSISEEVYNIFTINASTGLLMLVGDLDYEKTHNYSFDVTVTDHGNPPLSSTANILITVLDLNDNSPYFEQELYQLFVEENSILNLPIFTVPGIDIDDTVNSELRYTILSGNIGFKFDLEETTGVLSVSDYIDRELTTDFFLTVRVVDLGIPQYTATTTLDINVIDINDHSPHFSDNILSVSIPENTPHGTIIFELQATDDDIGSNAKLSYEIIDGDSDRYPFYVENFTGHVVVNGSLDIESIPIYSLSLLVHDNGDIRRYDTAVLTILLQDINKHSPQYFIQSYTLNITEETAIGTPIAYLIAMDLDNNNDESVLYMISTSNTNNFAITDTGTLYVYQILNVGSFHLTINASDSVFTRQITVDITVHSRSYTGPLFQSPTYYYEISEATHINATVGSVSLSSNVDLLAFVTPDQNHSNIAADHFKINNNGSIILIDQLDFETSPYYVLNLQTTSSLGQTVYTIITILVIDYNDHPPLFSSSEFTIFLSELTPPGTSIITLQTYDLDSPGVNSDTRIQLVDRNETFSLNEYTKVVSLTQPLDRELEDTLIVTVNATNYLTSPLLYSMVTIHITVADENDNDPHFSEVFYSTNVFETTPIDTEVAVTEATDIDEGSNAKLVYSITYQSSPGAFYINHNNGSVYSKTSFDGMEGSLFTVSIMVADHGSPIPRVDTTILFVTVFKDNLEAPVFSQPDGYALSIDETQPVGSSVLQVSALDPEYNTSAVYYSMQSNLLLPFTISPTSGVITILKKLNYNTNNFYSISLSATDFGNPPKSTTTQLNITIIDINNHSPVFDAITYFINITENVPSGIPVLQVHATDVDAASILYKITVNHLLNGINAFNINETTGEIVIATPINREVSPTIELLISAIDTGYSIQRSTSVPVIIDVNDINDETPIFNQSEYNVDIIRLLPPGQQVITVYAYDTDILSDTLIYNISFQSIPGLFTIDATTGVITTAYTVPEDVLNSTNISVTVHDGVQTSSVIVNVNAVDDGTFCEGEFCTSVAPRLLQCNYIIPSNPICKPYCTNDKELSQKTWLCLSYSCLNSEQLPCVINKECLPQEMACAGICPIGKSVCPTTNICYALSNEQPCDVNTCLNGQTLIQRSNGTRYCVPSSSLPIQGQICNTSDVIYCEELNVCSNLTAPHLCQACPDGLIACPDTKECVTDSQLCCGYDADFCQLLSKCLPTGEICQLPNIAPIIPSPLIYIDSIDQYNSAQPPYKGHMVGIILGNNSIAVDEQNEEVSIAITDISNTSQDLGEWQYALCHSSFSVCTTCLHLSTPWIKITNVSDDNALYLPNTACLRFWRKSIEVEGAVWLSGKLWDGNTNGYLSNSTTLVRYQQPYHNTTLTYSTNGPISQNSTLLLSLLLPLTEPPTLSSDAPLTLTTIDEEVPLEHNLGDRIDKLVLSVSTDYLLQLSESKIQGLPDSNIGLSYEELIPTFIKDEYYNNATKSNVIRKQRLQTLSSGQGTGVAVSLLSLNSPWQVSINGDPQLFVYINDILSSTDQLLLLNTSSLIRFLPSSNFHGTERLGVRAWDGVIPDSSAQLTVHNSLTYISSLDALGLYHVNTQQYIKVSVNSIPDVPTIIQTTTTLPTLPYILEYHHERLFTVLVGQSVDSLRSIQEALGGLLSLILDETVSVHRLYPASGNSTYLSFTVDNNELTLSEINDKITSKDIVDSVIPIISISQDSHYGPGSPCYSDNTAVTGAPTSRNVNVLASQLANDNDNDFLGLAVVNVNDGYGQGVWQYLRSRHQNYSDDIISSLWINFPPNITNTNALLLHGNDSLRFLPKPLYYWLSTDAPKITVKAWDTTQGELGSLESSWMNINTDPFSNTTQSLSNRLGLFSSSTATIVATRFGCDGVVNSQVVHDACCICGGNGATCAGCDNVQGSNVKKDGCDICGGSENTCLGCDYIPFSFASFGICSECISTMSVPSDNNNLQATLYPSTSFQDCSGTCFGMAVNDDCGVCSGGGTSHSYNEDKDCHGVCFGNNTVDNCGYCTGPETDISFNEYLDCTGVCNGPFRADSCGICQLPDSDGAITEYADCNGDCFGTAKVDYCGECYGGNTDETANSTMDICGICGGDNSTCYGCDGVINSEHAVDSCQICGGNDCGCFHITTISPQMGPRTGSTQITIKGAGFFKNGTLYNNTLPLCGSSLTDSLGKSIPVTCQFISNDEETIPGSAYIVDQSTVICQTPALIDDQIFREQFDLSIRIDNGPFSNSVPFYYDNYNQITVTDISPKEDLINTKITLIHTGQNFMNSSLAACLVYGYDTCIPEYSNNYLSVPAVFINPSTYYCILPSKSYPCQIKVDLTLDGQVSGTVTPDIFDSVFTYSFSAPIVNSIHFTDNISSLVVLLDRSSILSNNQDISCDAIFTESTVSLLGGNNAQCFWANDYHQEILVTLPYQANIAVNSPIAFKDNVIGTMGPQFSLKVQNTITYISNVTNAIYPVPVILGPHFIPNCGYIQYTVTGSLYQGYKGFRYQWSIYTHNSSISGFSEVVSTLNNLPSTAGEISLPSNLFQLSVPYTLKVEVTNSLGLSASVSRTISKTMSSILEVEITGPKEKVINTGENLLVEGYVINNECSLPNGPFIYQWRLYRIIDQLQNILQHQLLSNIVSNNPILYIPSSVFMSDSKYQLQLTVTANNDAITSNDTIDITILPPLCVAHIHGGDRNISSSETVLLNASSSTIIEELKSSPTYTWACSVVGNGGPCYNTTKSVFVPIYLPKSPNVFFPTSNLQSGLQYNFTLILSHGGCISTSTVIISTYPSFVDPIAVVQILTTTSRVVSSQYLTLEGLVYPNYLVNVSWSCLDLPGQGYIDLNTGNYTISPTYYMSTSTINVSPLTEFVNEAVTRQTNRVNLVIKPHSLQPGWKYTFQLSAQHDQIIVYSKITVIPEHSPVIRNFFVTPHSGVALNTPFKLSVNWTTDNVKDHPLYYQFGVVLSQAKYWLTGPSTEKSITVNLPPGDLVVIARVYDSLSVEYNEYQIDVSVSSNPSSINYQSTIDHLANDLQNTKEWPTVISGLVTTLLSVSNTLNNAQSKSVLNLYSNILSNYMPSTKEHHTLMLTTMELMTTTLSFTEINDKITILNQLNSILDAFIKTVDGNFQQSNVISMTDNSGLPLLLTSDRYSLQDFNYGIDDRAIDTVVNIITNLYASNWDSTLARQLRQTMTKLSSVLCRQHVIGQQGITINTNILSYSFEKQFPFGTFFIEEATIDFSNKLHQFYIKQACSHASIACSEICLNFITTTKDYFSNTSQIVTISTKSQDAIKSGIEGVDPQAIQLHSDIISVDLATALQQAILSVQNLPSPIHVYIPVRSISNDKSQPICMFRNTTVESNSQWELDTLAPPPVISINGREHYSCEYNHLSEFAIGLLPPPVIISSSTPSVMESSSPTSSPSPTSSHVIMSSSPTVSFLPIVNNPGPVIAGVVVTVIFMIILTSILIVIAFIVWRKKHHKKLRIVAVTPSGENKVLLEEEPAPPAKDDGKISLGVIQLLADGERLALGSVNALPSMRLRELRTQLTEVFDSLQNKPFYLCTKELCDIDPSSEQQQFVSIVYGSIVYIREITAVTEKTKKEFCICSAAAQFECTGCARGYCSQECQLKHWEDGHQKECQRVSEKRQRTDILLRQQTPTNLRLSSIQEGTEESSQQKPSVSTPTDWKSFLSDSKRYSSPPISPRTSVTVQPLPPLTGQRGPVNKEQYQELKQQFKSYVQEPHSDSILQPQSQVSMRQKLPRLASTGQVTTIGRLASQTPLQLPRPGQSSLPPASFKSRTQSLQAPELRSQPSLSPLNIEGYHPMQNIPGPYQYQQSINSQQLTNTYSQQQLGQLFNKQEFGHQLSQNPTAQTPYFMPARPSQPQPSFHRGLSITSVESADLNLSNMSNLPLKKDVRNEPILEQDHESSSSSSTESDDDVQEHQVSRPPSLAVRRRHSSRVQSQAIPEVSHEGLVDTSSDESEDIDKENN